MIVTRYWLSYLLWADHTAVYVKVIGGPGIIVEVDKSKFSKYKKDKGRAVASKKGVSGGIEQTEECNYGRQKVSTNPWRGHESTYLSRINYL